jgi:hypothetical protein
VRGRDITVLLSEVYDAVRAAALQKAVEDEPV